jgi:DNA-binding NarL/FixJ family response regulator
MDGTTNSHPIIALVDHRELTRTALIRSFGEALPGAVFIGASRIEDLAALATENLRVVILHIGNHADEGGSDFETIAAAHSAIAPVPLITLAEHADDEALRASIEGGASAHLTTKMPLEIAAATLRLVILGGTSFPVSSALVRRKGKSGAADSDDCLRIHCLSDRLTQREEEVLKLVGEGAQNKIIAYRLSMSENTVKVHLHRILQKFHLHNRTEAALIARTYFEAPHLSGIGAAIQPQVGLISHSPSFLSKAS